jgi:sigma-E factor negative regulatory protein RseB
VSLYRSARSSFLASAFLVHGLALADDAAHEWLMKMNHAARTLNYLGTFVYQNNGQLEAMRIIHKVDGGTTRERLVSLSGAPREIIRTEREVVCYLPDMGSVVVEYRKLDIKYFPGLLPERLQELDENYVIRLGGSGRVAGRPAQIVTIAPRDGYRYGYRLWADRETGLLLKAALLDQEERILEQFMFTHVTIGQPIPASALDPDIRDEGLKWYRETAEDGLAHAEPNWTATRLPKGFKLTTYLSRREPLRRKPLEHLVYSDGLAAVSVFIERRGEGKLLMRGTTRMGAVHAFGKELDGYQVTAVGEVPAATITLIGGSVAPLR